jgi:hypothetical protein
MKFYKKLVLFLFIISLVSVAPKKAEASLIVVVGTLFLLKKAGLLGSYGEGVPPKPVAYSLTELDQALNFIQGWCVDVNFLKDFYSNRDLLGRMDEYRNFLASSEDNSDREFAASVDQVRAQSEEAYYAELMKHLYVRNPKFKAKFERKQASIRETNKCNLPAATAI